MEFLNVVSEEEFTILGGKLFQTVPTGNRQINL